MILIRNEGKKDERPEGDFTNECPGESGRILKKQSENGREHGAAAIPDLKLNRFETVPDGLDIH